MKNSQRASHLEKNPWPAAVVLQFQVGWSFCLNNASAGCGSKIMMDFFPSKIQLQPMNPNFNAVKKLFSKYGRLRRVGFARALRLSSMFRRGASGGIALKPRSQAVVHAPRATPTPTQRVPRSTGTPAVPFQSRSTVSAKMRFYAHPLQADLLLFVQAG